MKRIRTLLTVSTILLSACAPQNSANDVTPLGVDTKSKEHVVQSGLSTSLAPAEAFETFATTQDDRSFHSDIAFYEVVLSYGPISDPRPIFLLANAYIATNQQSYGISFLEWLLKRYSSSMTDDVKAVYLSAYALLRATYADRVPLPGRVFWVLDTFDVLEDAKALSEENPLVHWSAGLIYSQVPGFFGKRDEAMAELLWLVERPELEPNPGFYREPYHILSKLYARAGEAEAAERYLKKSGYEDYEPQVPFMGWFVTTKEKGLLFSPTPWIEEIVADRVFAVRGFGFSDLHFVVSDDQRALISIDAGTQPYSMEAGYKFLVERHPDLPKLTTVFVTHAHWDHIGGFSYLMSLNPEMTIYGRGNYEGTVDRVLRSHSYHQFRGATFENEWVSAYRPNVVVNNTTELTVGGTSFELIPVTSGETEDALLIHVPDLGVLFMGDALMPFYGEPWVEEGFIDAAMDAMDTALDRKPTHILHGHLGITVLYATSEQLETFRGAYEWLVIETRKHLKSGYSAKDIIRLNLIPPGLQNQPHVFFSYLAPRDPIIKRMADRFVGIFWEEVTGRDPGGLDVLTTVEYGRLLDLYLGLPAYMVAKALRRMLDGGDLELALQMAVAAETRYPNNGAITLLKEEAGDRLRSVAQYFDPFKFVVYTELIGKEHKSIPAEFAR